MLSNTSTLYLKSLCEKYPENKYIVVEWSELRELVENPSDDYNFEEIWKELKINNCVVYKYNDEEEVCFTLTDKARLIVQEYNVLMQSAVIQDSEDEEEQQEIIKDSYIKTDDDGRTVVVMPKEVVQEKKKFELKKIKHNAFYSGIVGGLIGGSIAGLIFGFLGALIVKLIG